MRALTVTGDASSKGLPFGPAFVPATEIEESGIYMLAVLVPATAMRASASGVALVFLSRISGDTRYASTRYAPEAIVDGIGREKAKLFSCPGDIVRPLTATVRSTSISGAPLAFTCLTMTIRDAAESA